MTDLNKLLDEEDREWPKSWKSKPGDRIVGEIIGFDRSTHGKYGQTDVLMLRLDEPDDEGETERTIWRGHTVLDDELRKLEPKVGDRIGIRRLESNGKRYARYRVRIHRTSKADQKNTSEGSGDVGF